MKPPHARPDPRYFPPDDRTEPLASALLGVAAIVLLAAVAFILLPALA